jgi:hypothetical protein
LFHPIGIRAHAPGSIPVIGKYDAKYEKMPVSIRSLTDEEMFELAVREKLSA